MEKIKISVAIGSYQQAAILKRVLEAYSHQSMPQGQFEVVVVDSGSQDDTAALLAEYATYPWFRYFIQENNGKSAARNRAVTECQADLIIITDADMIPDARFIQSHYEAHQAADQPCCFEGLTYNMSQLTWPPTPQIISPYIRGRHRNGKRLGWYYFLSGNISLPKSVFETHNGFDEAFIGYGWEDIELGYRFSKAKVPLFYLKNAINYHFHLFDEGLDVNRAYDKGRSARIFRQKHPELALFLGINPLSNWLYHRLKQLPSIQTTLNQWANHPNEGWRKQFATWLLKEFHYRRGIL